MFRRNGALFALAAITALVIAGCGAATPTRLLPTQPPQIITVIITATPPPSTATLSAPSITPLPTVNVTTTAQTAATETKPTAVAGATKPAVVATKKPTAPLATTVAPSPLPLTLPAPKLVRPNFSQDTGQRDESHSPSDSLVFVWESISPLAQNVCYMIRVDFLPTNNQPGTGDAFLQCDPTQTTKVQSQGVSFTLYRPGYAAVNYSGLLPNPPTDLLVKWSVTVVADQGPGTGPTDAATGIRHKVVPLSPKSDTFQFPLKDARQ